MKAIRLLKIIALVLATTAAARAASPTPEKLNPNKSPEVDRGYQQHQKEHHEKRQKEQSQEKPKGDSNYDVNKSKDTARGSAGRPR